MIYKETMLEVADNSGAKTVQVISRRYGNSRARSIGIGDIIKVVVKDALPSDTDKVKGEKSVGRNKLVTPGSKLEDGDVVQALVINCKSSVSYSNGIRVTGTKNECVLLTEKRELIGTRINAFIPTIIRRKILSYSGVGHLLVQNLISASLGER